MQRVLWLPLILVLSTAQAPVPEPVLTADAVRAASTPVRTVNPSDDDFSDLQFLKSVIGNARVVVLGEQTHFDGTSTAAKARLIKFLHREMDFGVLVLENDFWHVRHANTEMRKGVPLADQTWPSAFQSRYAEILPLYEHIARSANSAKPLELAGMDAWYTLYDPAHAAVLGPAVVAFFDAASPSLLTAEQRDFLGRIRWPYTSGPREASAETTAKDQAAFTSLIALIDGNAESLTKAHGRKEVAFMRLAFENRVLYPRFYELLQTNRRTNADYVHPREAQIARNLDFLVNDLYADRKLILWASHSHTMKNGVELGLATHLTSVEVLASKLPPQAMVTIGFTAHEGKSGYGVRSTGEVDASMPGSLEAAANEVGPEYQIVDLRKLPGAYRTKLWPRPQMLSEWKKSFDLVFYMKTQRPLSAAR